MELALAGFLVSQTFDAVLAFLGPRPRLPATIIQQEEVDTIMRKG